MYIVSVVSIGSVRKFMCVPTQDKQNIQLVEPRFNVFNSIQLVISNFYLLIDVMVATWINDDLILDT